MTDLLLFDDETLDAAEYSPTPEDIEAELLAIQGEWTPEERLRRQGLVEVKTCRVSEFKE
jgi:hypothetical protein